MVVNQQFLKVKYLISLTNCSKRKENDLVSHRVLYPTDERCSVNLKVITALKITVLTHKDLLTTFKANSICFSLF